MGVSAAEEAGPDETEEARPDETRRRAEAPRVTPREKSVVDASAPVATMPPMYCVRPDGPPREQAERSPPRGGWTSPPWPSCASRPRAAAQCALAGSGQTIGGRDELELRILREPRQGRSRRCGAGRAGFHSHPGGAAWLSGPAARRGGPVSSGDGARRCGYV